MHLLIDTFSHASIDRYTLVYECIAYGMISVNSKVLTAYYYILGKKFPVLTLIFVKLKTNKTLIFFFFGVFL